MLKTIFIIFLGGGLGSISRFLISFYTRKFILIGSFPLGTLLVNVLGCFLIGYFSNMIKDNYLKLFFTTGFCGGFTTFSTSSLENITLWKNGDYRILFLYFISSIILGILGVLLGINFGKVRI